MADEGYFYCHNCNRGWTPMTWIQQVCGLSYKDIMTEINEFGYSIDDIIEPQTQIKKVDFGTLPEDSINLLDPNQVNYYSQNTAVQQCLKIIQQRRLNLAINRPKTLWVSLKDKVHKNRLCIPFYDDDNQIRFYQTRAVMPEDLNDNRPKYLSKLNSDKRIYGINNIDSNRDYIFIFEGPIDSMFTVNGVAICGLHLTNIQKQILQRYNLYKQIWVLDNQIIDKASKEKTMELIDRGERVFIWPEKLKKYKDFNDICINFEINEISNKFIIDNSFEGIEAKTRLKINQHR